MTRLNKKIIGLYLFAIMGFFLPQPPVYSFNADDLERLRVSHSCHGCDLSYANLSSLDLSRANLSGSILLNADLTGTNLYRANLSGANLIDAKLHGTNFRRAKLAKAYWINGKKCRAGSIGKCRQR